MATTTPSSWFNAQEYLASKLEQLKAAGYEGWTAADNKSVADLEKFFADNGIDAYEHFVANNAVEQTSPSALFNSAEYFAAKAEQINASEAGFQGRKDWTATEVAKFFADNGLSAWDHYNNGGWAEAGLPALKSFDAAGYFAAKADQINASEEGFQGRKDWTATEVAKYFADNGVNPVSHYLEVGKTEVPDFKPAPSTSSTLTEALAALEKANAAVTAKETEIADFLQAALKVEAVEKALGNTDPENATDDQIETAIADAYSAVEGALGFAAGQLNNASATKQTALLKAARDALVADVDLAKVDVADAKEDLATDITSLIATAQSKLDAVTVAVKGQAATQSVTSDAMTVAKAFVTNLTRTEVTEAVGTEGEEGYAPASPAQLKAGNTVVATQSVSGVWIINKDLVLEDGAYTIGETTLTAERLNALITALNNEAKAQAAVTAAETAYAKAYTAVVNAQGAKDFVASEEVPEYVAVEKTFAQSVTSTEVVDGNYTMKAFENTALAQYAQAVSDLESAEAAVTTFDENVASWKEIGALVSGLETKETELATLVKAAADAKAAIENAVDAEENPGLGVDLLDAVDGVVTFTAGDDLFVLAGTGALTLSGFGEAGTDNIYVGTGFKGIVTGTNTGSVSDLEIIVREEGGNTILYFEQKSFAGNSSNLSVDSTVVTLTGVTGAEFSLSADGLLTIA